MFGLEQFLQTRDAFFLQRGQIVNYGAGLVVLTAAVVWLLKYYHKFYLARVHLAVLLLAGLSFTSQLWTLAPKSFDMYYSSARPYFILFLLVAPIITLDKRSIKDGIRTALLIGIPLVYLFVFVVDWEGRGIRLAAPTFDNGRLTWIAPPLALSSMAAYIGIISIIITPKQLLFKLIFIFTAALAFYVTFRTQSRGQLLAMGIVTLICYPLANRATRLKGLFITTAGFSVLALGLYLVFTNLELGTINRWSENKVQGDLEGRFAMLQTLLQKWSSGGPFTLLFGIGSAGAFSVSGFYVHNLPGEILGELGLIGMGIFTYIYIETIINSMKIIKKLDYYPETRRESIAIIALFIFGTIISLKQGSFFSWPELFFFAIAIAHLEKHSRSLVAQDWEWRRLFLINASKQNQRLGIAR
ncbi:MAG: hypothetical protein P8M80_11765 [Pirellulaceae bacterium]|nr:hypothetical protein [Pirellulaceae bacterium]